MSVVAELDVPVDDFLLAETIDEAPDIEIDIVRVATGQATITPYVWAFGEHLEPLVNAMESDSSIAGVRALDQRKVPDRSADHYVYERLFRVDWDDTEPALLRAIDGGSGAVLDARYTGGTGWELTVLFPDRSALSTLHEKATDDGITLDLRRVYAAHQTHERGTYGITEEQYEALTAAYRAGYFEVPRDRTLSDIAAGLDISANALSARLRRGFRTLLSNTLIQRK